MKSELKSPEQLPDLPGDELHFELLEQKWEVQGLKETCYVTRHEGEVIWAELAAYESWQRLPEIKRIFREKVREPDEDLRGRGYSFAYGDDIGSIEGLDNALSAI